MAYVIVAWISVSIGILMGAAWAGLGKRNKYYDQQHDYKLTELYSKLNEGDL